MDFIFDVGFIHRLLINRNIFFVLAQINSGKCNFESMGRIYKRSYTSFHEFAYLLKLNDYLINSYNVLF